MKGNNKLLDKLKSNPPFVLGFTFAIVIFIGACLLTLPIASVDNTSSSFVDALFTASSATCVTGLIVRNTATGWSAFGKFVIISLIQIGGLGTMTIIALISVALKKRIGLRDRMAIREQLNTSSLTGMVRLTKYVVAVSFAIEGIGALLLSIRFIPEFGFSTGVIYSIFHAISAFCNAGFDILGNNIVPYQSDWLINLVIGGLVIIGGLGFSVYVDIYKNKKFSKFKVHTKMVLLASASLLILGTVLILVFEYKNPKTLGTLNFSNKVLASGFQSAIVRTAGFNSIDIGGLTDASAFLMVILMFIGGSPGSTAGGLKTTTVGVLLLMTLSIIKDEEEVVWQRRTIPFSIVKKAFAMAVICIVIVVLVTSIITILEHDRFEFLDILFETVSAFGTVGLTRGITPDLGEGSKLMLSLTMFLGRVGPTTLALGFGRGIKKKRVRYAESPIAIG